MSKLLCVNKHLTAERSISQHVIKGLLKALKQEKKRRKRGKRLNLLGEDDSGAQFFSPIRVQAAREYQAIKAEDELIKRQGIAERKAQAAAKKKQKEEDKEKELLLLLKDDELLRKRRLQRWQKDRLKKSFVKQLTERRKSTRGFSRLLRSPLSSGRLQRSR